MSKPNSPDGISIAANAPECNNATLNGKQPAVICQYYGMNIGEESGQVIKRVAYGSQWSISSEGSDPRKLTIKPFFKEIEVISKYIHDFLIKDLNDFQWQLTDLSRAFNSCTILLYHTLLDVKKESSMGWHCDSK